MQGTHGGMWKNVWGWRNVSDIILGGLRWAAIGAVLIAAGAFYGYQRWHVPEPTAQDQLAIASFLGRHSNEQLSMGDVLTQRLANVYVFTYPAGPLILRDMNIGDGWRTSVQVWTAPGKPGFTLTQDATHTTPTFLAIEAIPQDQLQAALVPTPTEGG